MTGLNCSYEPSPADSPDWILDCRRRFQMLTLGNTPLRPSSAPREVVELRRYLLVLDMDLLAVDEQYDLEPINHLVERQQQEPCEVVVLSLVGQPQLPAMELLLGARVGKFPKAPAADHDIAAAAEHRMNLAVRHLTTIGCQASGIISDENDPVKAVRSETRGHTYDEVILATGRQRPSWLARIMHRDPVHQLQRQWGQRLIVFRQGRGGSESARV
jgi:hypothetical protein